MDGAQSQGGGGKPMSVSVIVQMLVTLSGLAAVYANSVANDREHSTSIVQARTEHSRLQERVERDARELRLDIRTDLSEIKAELRELRAETNRRGQAAR